MSSWRTSTVPAAYVPAGSVKEPLTPVVQVAPPLMLDSHVAPAKSPATVTDGLFVMPSEPLLPVSAASASAGSGSGIAGADSAE